MSERIRGFTEEEAVLILQHAAKETDPIRRWIPLLCAYSGARLSEVCQLRKQDVFEHEGICCIKFAPEAGSLKNASSERVVPLHPALVDAGFQDFVSSSKAGPLFSMLGGDRFGNRGGRGTKAVSRWVRAIGITDERISPTHSWRHRFKTLGQRHGLMTDIVNAMTGHHRKTVADANGEFPIAALHRELRKTPDCLAQRPTQFIRDQPLVIDPAASTVQIVDENHRPRNGRICQLLEPHSALVGYRDTLARTFHLIMIVGREPNSNNPGRSTGLGGYDFDHADSRRCAFWNVSYGIMASAIGKNAAEFKAMCRDRDSSPLVYADALPFPLLQAVRDKGVSRRAVPLTDLEEHIAEIFQLTEVVRRLSLIVLSGLGPDFQRLAAAYRRWADKHRVTVVEIPFFFGNNAPGIRIALRESTSSMVSVMECFESEPWTSARSGLGALTWGG